MTRNVKPPQINLQTVKKSGLFQIKKKNPEIGPDFDNIIKENYIISNDAKDFNLESYNIVQEMNEDNANYMFRRPKQVHLN